MLRRKAKRALVPSDKKNSDINEHNKKDLCLAVSGLLHHASRSAYERDIGLSAWEYSLQSGLWGPRKGRKNS